MNSTTHEEPQVLPKPPKTKPLIKPIRKTPFNPGPKIDPKPKALILLLMIFFMFGCNNDTVVLTKDEYKTLKNIPKSEYPKQIKISHISGNYFVEDAVEIGQILLIDTCEYIFIERNGNGGPALTHKGNCKFCKQRYNEFR